jgi:aldose sugar dehydrogenase
LKLFFNRLTIIVIWTAIFLFIYYVESTYLLAFSEPANIKKVSKIITNQEQPSIADSNLGVKLVAGGLKKPTSMAFLAPYDILVLEKENGTVQRIIHGERLPQPLLDVNVNSEGERGMLGIAVLLKNNHTKNDKTFVFLYYTEAKSKDGGQPLGNRLYRYELADNKLEHPKLLLDLPATPGPRHNGGAIAVGPDNSLYVPVGDIDGSFNPQGKYVRTLAQNYVNSTVIDGRSGILKIRLDGRPVIDNSTLGRQYPLNLYYAYGIRNSFGIDFDPVTGNLWDTENGPAYGDEINLIKPGFNSGYVSIQGVWQYKENGNLPPPYWKKHPIKSMNLVNFDGQGTYSAPEFTWNDTIGVTAIKFFHSNEFGLKYVDDLFVSGFVTGKIYHFDLNYDRTRLALKGDLEDTIAESEETVQGIVFAKGFGGISDMEIGADGRLYVVSINQGKIFNIGRN